MVGSDADLSDRGQRQATRLRTLAESGRAFAEATTDLDRLLQTVAQRFADFIGDGCYLRLLGPDGVSLVPVATYHPDPLVQRFLRETTDNIPLRVGEGISGRVVETGEPCFMPEVPFEQYRRATKPEFVPIFESLGVTSMVVVPLRARSKSLGFIALVRNGVGRPAYTTDDLDLVTDLADRAALAIDNARILDDLERRVAERTKDLASANRELEAFTASVSHDLRAPVRAIDGFSRILEEDFGGLLGSEGQRVVAVIRKNTRLMGQLIEDLLRFARFGRAAIEPIALVHMRALVDGVIADVRERDPGRDIEIRVGDLPDAEGNQELLRQVWFNLVDNAVKYTSKTPRAVIAIAGSIEGGEVRYTVSDNGPGFEQADAGKLFTVFQRLHPDFEGTGVGLALVERIISRHGGRVWALGEPNAGATFGFSLPRRALPA